MYKKSSMLLWMLVILLVISAAMAGCSSGGPVDNAKPVANAEPVVAEQSAETDFVTVYVFTPVDWYDVHVWAWKDGGEDAFAEWPGTPAEHNPEAQCVSASVPAWIDRLVISAHGGTVQTADLSVEQGKDVWIAADSAESYIFYENPLAGREETVNEDPLFLAAEQGDFETVKSMLPSIEDRSILTDWAFNDFNYAYAADAIRAGDYETAIEFFGYCAYEDNRRYADIFRNLLAGDVEAAVEIKTDMGFTMLDGDLDMTWPEIICMVTGATEGASELECTLMDEYLTRRLWARQPEFTEDFFVFGEYSAWESPNYIGEIKDQESYVPVADLKKLTAQCGSEANGKILIVRCQKGYPQGSTHYAIDLRAMDQLSYDLYPASLSEVEYILVISYDYAKEGRYKQTFSVGDNSTVDYFDFLRMKGQVQLKEVPSGKTVQQSQWIQGTGEADAHFSDLSYQCSNMPEVAPHIMSAVEKVRELNAA